MATKSIDDPNLFESYPKETPIESGFLYDFGDRTYRALEMNLEGLSRLKVNLKVSQGGASINSATAPFHIDTLDLYLDRARERFIQVSAKRFGISPDVIEGELSALIQKLDEKRVELLQQKTATPAQTMSDEEREEALEFLRSPDLTRLIQQDFERTGYIGEETARLFCYLAVVSRFLKKPLGVLIVSRSGAGKSSLQEAVCRFVPKSDLMDLARLSGKALYYEKSLKHTVLAIAEDEGALEAIYPLRILQSEQRLTVAVASVDPRTGEKRTENFEVEGPISIFWTSTNAEKIDFETRNRFAIITIDESREQTRRILERQREEDSLEGVLDEEDSERIIRKHHNAQKLLRPLKVVNPYYHKLTYPDDKLIMRREQKKYLTLVKAIALLHQYGRDVKTARTKAGKPVEYIEVTPDDIALANRLAAEVLGRSLDELSPHTRHLLRLIKQMVDERTRKEKKKQSDIALTRRDISTCTGWSYFQTREPLETLVRMEYLALVKSQKHNQYLYELLWDGQGESGERFFMGLIDPETIKGNGSLRVPKSGLRVGQSSSRGI